MQRALAVESTSYAGLVDETRRQLAMAYVCEGRLTVTNIAHRLGFVSVASFIRAFRRWTGKAPSEFRIRPSDEPRQAVGVAGHDGFGRHHM
jgi:AraC-like DNA-binding protein